MEVAVEAPSLWSVQSIQVGSFPRRRHRTHVASFEEDLERAADQVDLMNKVQKQAASIDGTAKLINERMKQLTNMMATIEERKALIAVGAAMRSAICRPLRLLARSNER